MRFKFDSKKSKLLKSNPKRGIDFVTAQKVWNQPYYLDQRSDNPEQYRAIGWVDGQLFSVIFELREDKAGEYIHLITIWKSTKQERHLYEKST